MMANDDPRDDFSFSWNGPSPLNELNELIFKMGINGMLFGLSLISGLHSLSFQVKFIERTFGEFYKLDMK